MEPEVTQPVERKVKLNRHQRRALQAILRQQKKHGHRLNVEPEEKYQEITE